MKILGKVRCVPRGRNFPRRCFNRQLETAPCVRRNWVAPASRVLCDSNDDHGRANARTSAQSRSQRGSGEKSLDLQGDTVATYAAGFDNAATDAAYPLSKAQMPAISGANGQADVTTSASGTSTYP